MAGFAAFSGRSQDSRIEIWKNVLYPGFIGEDYDFTTSMKEDIKKLERPLRERFGSKIISAALGGSRAKGTAEKGETGSSDFDLILCCRNMSHDEIEKLQYMLMERLPAEKRMTLEVHGIDVGKILESIRGKMKIVTEEIAACFAGDVLFGKDDLENARKEILYELAELPNAAEIWDSVVEDHFKKDVMLTRNFKKLGISASDFEEIMLERMKKFSLPDLKEMEEKYLGK
jgi:predicted nucleotidyltransferase